jgi:hypothetical protein
VWTAPLSFDTRRPNVSVHLEIGWFASDDVVLLAEGVDVLDWSWHSMQLNTSNRLVLNFNGCAYATVCFFLIFDVSQIHLSSRISEFKAKDIVSIPER